MTRMIRDNDSLVRKLHDYPELNIRGFASDKVPFSRHMRSNAMIDETVAEMSAWDAAKQDNSMEGYQAYLSAYPKGRWAQNAKTLLTALVDGERTSAAIEEGELRFGQDDRRRIQDILVDLGYATNGRDGIFGSVTRESIAKWQKKNGYLATSYLNAQQYIALLSSKFDQIPKAEQKDITPLKSNTLATQPTATPSSDNSLAYMKRYKNGIFAETSLALKEEDQVNVEKRLVTLGLLNKVPDGLFNEPTRSAISNFQLRNQLHASGYLNRQTLTLLLESGGNN